MIADKYIKEQFAHELWKYQAMKLSIFISDSVH
jgi:hypothetical protein